MSNYDEIAYDPDNDIDDEYDEEENEILERKRKEIEQFTLEDYMDCKSTKDILLTNWRQQFSDNLEEKIETIFNDHFSYMKQTSANILSRANKNHISDLVSLVSFHVTKEYDLSVFMDNPDLAQELVDNFNEIQEARREEIKKQHAKALKEANKVFDWSKRKK